MKILILQNRMGIGDMIMFLPFIEAISKKFKTPVTILLIIPYPSHKINNGAKAKTGIDWLASNIGIIHLFNVTEEEIIKAVDIPIREPITIEAKISISV